MFLYKYNVGTENRTKNEYRKRFKKENSKCVQET